MIVKSLHGCMRESKSNLKSLPSKTAKAKIFLLYDKAAVSFSSRSQLTYEANSFQFSSFSRDIRRSSGSNFSSPPESLHVVRCTTAVFVAPPLDFAQGGRRRIVAGRKQIKSKQAIDNRTLAGRRSSCN